jgi:hypothetical protein
MECPLFFSYKALMDFDFHYELAKLNGKVWKLRTTIRRTPGLSQLRKELQELENDLIYLSSVALSDPERYDFKEKRKRKLRVVSPCDDENKQMRMFA